MHTKEPWKYIDVLGGCSVYAGPREVLSYQYSPDKENKANARRVVACVNACAGIPTDELETTGLPLYMHESLTKQRDELLAALKDARAIFAMAYDCAENGRSDECLLHLGVGGARVDKVIGKADLTQ